MTQMVTMNSQITEVPEKAIEVGSPEHFLNRYLSLLNFNLRVLEQAEDPNVPLFERVRFLLIFSSNMDEFFEIRLAGLQRDITYHQARPEADGMAPTEVLRIISERCHVAILRQYALLNDVPSPVKIFMCRNAMRGMPNRCSGSSIISASRWHRY